MSLFQFFATLAQCCITHKYRHICVEGFFEVCEKICLQNVAASVNRNGAATLIQNRQLCFNVTHLVLVKCRSYRTYNVCFLQSLFRLKNAHCLLERDSARKGTFMARMIARAVLHFMSYYGACQMNHFNGFPSQISGVQILFRS